MMTSRRLLSLALPLVLAAPAASAQTGQPADVAGMSIEDLLAVHVVTTASRFPQKTREAPASIAVVTGDEIRDYGHRTLADVLRSVGGLYTTYDRNYSYVGIRGFARPGDYNTRVLLLVDGHRMNDPIYDMAAVGTDFPIDVSLIDKVEVIRGPASSLYGTNALLAVINVVTRTGAQHDGLRIDSRAGSLGTRSTTVSFGRLFRNGTQVLLAGTGYGSEGASRMEFPELAAGPGQPAVVEHMDGDVAGSVFGSLTIGRLSIQGGANRRRKRVPTASFGSVFGDDRLETIDDRAYLAAEYEGPIGRGWSAQVRAAYDFSGYQGFYPYDYGLPEPVMWLDRSDNKTLSAEATMRRRLHRAHLFTAGAEVRRDLALSMSAEDGVTPPLDVRSPATISGAFAQDEMRVRPWLLVNAGVRLDRSARFGTHTTPRVGVVLLPRAVTTVKLLHGRAFRAPNVYELEYYAPMREHGFVLRPERMRSTEIVWEEYLTSRLRSEVTVFRYTMEGLVEQRSLVGADVDDLYFANSGTTVASGLEVSLEGKFAAGINAYWNHAFVRAREEADAPLSNSPEHLMKLGVRAPVSRFTLGVEGQYMSSRRTLDGSSVGGSFLPNATLSSAVGARLELGVGVYNALDISYADPAAEEHVQHSIPQDGRTVLARARVRF